RLTRPEQRCRSGYDVVPDCGRTGKLTLAARSTYSQKEYFRHARAGSSYGRSKGIAANFVREAQTISGPTNASWMSGGGGPSTGSGMPLGGISLPISNALKLSP